MGLKVRIVSEEFSFNNFYFDQEEHIFYIDEDDYYKNKKEPIDEYIYIDECGLVIDIDTNINKQNRYDIFIDEIITIEKYPEYFL